MSDSPQEKLAQAFEEQQAQWRAFTTKALESSMKLFELNLRIARQSMQDVAHSAQQLLTAKSPDQVLSIDQELAQEKLNQIMSYANEIGEITSSFTSGLGQAAQSNLHQTIEKATKLVEEVKPQADFQKFFPQIGDATHGYEQWLEAGKKIAESFAQAVPVTPTKPAPVKKPVAKASTRSRTRAK